MNKLDSIVVSNTEPNNKNVLWYDNKRLLIFSNGHWSPIVDLDDIDVDNLPGVSNLQEALKSLNIKVDNKVDKVEGKGLSTNDYTDREKSKLSTLPTSIEFDAALTAKQDKIVDSADIIVGWDDGIEGRTLYIEQSAKQKVFDDLWIKAADSNGKYDPANAPDPQHPFYLNTLWLTYNEAVASMAHINEIYLRGGGSMRNLSLRTNMLSAKALPTGWGTGFVKLDGVCSYCSTIEVLNVGNITVEEGDALSSFAYSCVKLHTILGQIDLVHVKAINASAFALSPKLQEVRLYRIKASVNFKDCPLLSLESLQYLVTNADNSNAITITVHPDIYAKLTGDTTNAAAAALTAEELAQWQALVTTANSKNISFATETA